VNFSGFQPYPFTRFGGIVDSEDPTILPLGVAAVCKNCRFQLTSVFCRYGLQTAATSPNAVPISGLFGAIYTPENPGETLFQAPLVFDTDGYLLIEKPVGSGSLQRIFSTLVTPPLNSHAIMTEAYNRVLVAYSNLQTPTAPANVYGLSSKYLDPYGQLPLGAPWESGTLYLVGNYVSPTVAGGNGHVYRCIVGGVSGGGEPTWPLTENGTVTDGQVTWEELTPVLANRLPAPSSPSLTRVASGGTFAAGRDVYVAITYTNQQGESVPSGPSVLSNTVLDDAVAVAIPTLASLAGWIRGLGSSYIPTGAKVYEADVAHGAAAPSSASFALVGNYALGATATVTTTASGSAPPSANTARVTPGGLQSPGTPTVERASGAGTFAAGRDVYVIATFTNSTGETIPSVAGVLIDTVLNDAVQVPVPSTTYQITGVNLYEADVATGSPAPASTSYALVGSFQPLSTATITATATGNPPPTTNTSGSAGSIAPDSTNVDDTGTQGLRYASIAFTNRNGNLSGTVPAFTSIFVDVPGYELYMANIPTGPSNIVNRTIGFTVADGTSVGPFFCNPANAVSAGVLQTTTVIPDNTTTTAFFNFTDEYLASLTSTDMTDRLRCIQPPPCVDIYYSPSIDRVVETGVDGYASGHYISLAADSESYYGDTSPIQVANGNGQRCICAREFQGTLYSLKERSGFTIMPTATDPSTWSVQQRWEGVGPCGPRAVWVGNKFMAFVHRSGLYAITSGSAEPILLSQDIPISTVNGIWNSINWDYQQTIWCCGDEETQELRVGVPMGNSTVPNVTLTLNYAEGIGGPVHFTTQDGNEKYLAGAHKWSVDSIAANCAVKMERETPANSSPFGLQRQTQFLLGSSSPDGTVQAITMGVYNDNGAGIDCQYETVCPPMNGINQLGGAAIDVTGKGAMSVQVVLGGTFVTSPGGGRQSDKQQTNVINLLDAQLTPEQWLPYAAGARGAQDAYMRLRFTNRKVADNWFGVKMATLFSRPLFGAKTSGQR
jgi:hypothetical protein